MVSPEGSSTPPVQEETGRSKEGEEQKAIEAMVETLSEDLKDERQQMMKEEEQTEGVSLAKQAESLQEPLCADPHKIELPEPFDSYVLASHLEGKDCLPPWVSLDPEESMQYQRDFQTSSMHLSTSIAQFDSLRAVEGVDAELLESLKERLFHSMPTEFFNDEGDDMDLNEVKEQLAEFQRVQQAQRQQGAGMMNPTESMLLDQSKMLLEHFEELLSNPETKKETEAVLKGHTAQADGGERSLFLFDQGDVVTLVDPSDMSYQIWETLASHHGSHVNSHLALKLSPEQLASAFKSVPMTNKEAAECTETAQTILTELAAGVNEKKQQNLLNELNEAVEHWETKGKRLRTDSVGPGKTLDALNLAVLHEEANIPTRGEAEEEGYRFGTVAERSLDLQSRQLPFFLKADLESLTWSERAFKRLDQRAREFVGKEGCAKKVVRKAVKSVTKSEKLEPPQEVSLSPFWIDGTSGRLLTSKRFWPTVFQDYTDEMDEDEEEEEEEEGKGGKKDEKMLMKRAYALRPIIGPSDASVKKKHAAFMTDWNPGFNAASLPALLYASLKNDGGSRIGRFMVLHRLLVVLFRMCLQVQWLFERGFHSLHMDTLDWKIQWTDRETRKWIELHSLFHRALKSEDPPRALGLLLADGMFAEEDGQYSTDSVAGESEHEGGGVVVGNIYLDRFTDTSLEINQPAEENLTAPDDFEVILQEFGALDTEGGANTDLGYTIDVGPGAMPKAKDPQGLVVRYPHQAPSIMPPEWAAMSLCDSAVGNFHSEAAWAGEGCLLLDENGKPKYKNQAKVAQKLVQLWDDELVAFRQLPPVGSEPVLKKMKRKYKSSGKTVDSFKFRVSPAYAVFQLGAIGAQILGGRTMEEAAYVVKGMELQKKEEEDEGEDDEGIRQVPSIPPAELAEMMLDRDGKFKEIVSNMLPRRMGALKDPELHEKLTGVIRKALKFDSGGRQASPATLAAEIMGVLDLVDSKLAAMYEELQTILPSGASPLDAGLPEDVKRRVDKILTDRGPLSLDPEPQIQREGEGGQVHMGGKREETGGESLGEVQRDEALQEYLRTTPEQRSKDLDDFAELVSSLSPDQIADFREKTGLSEEELEKWKEMVKDPRVRQAMSSFSPEDAAEFEKEMQDNPLTAFDFFTKNQGDVRASRSLLPPSSRGGERNSLADLPVSPSDILSEEEDMDETAPSEKEMRDALAMMEKSKSSMDFFRRGLPSSSESGESEGGGESGGGESRRSGVDDDLEDF
uniref:Uncharacterized protein n=1 Tax=Chromera velia CCMP2878 TaxID=1169474 RepID=A0A0G4FDT3_9ALVE|eukprot:Cvel_16431.t1-p1 / transcript=Cvel_16431.t1 / gene=Cvel_16431 / organism=Chromera_velia_CCMP2878 / gene_product=hypothetical protein / transcript_product=hypothetical protein / location=Cvel_scaffold1266:22763-31404(-) / protein_length=1247 / sequence_SO=supercontig / SO=protein_coding / is_pseudo=false